MSFHVLSFTPTHHILRDSSSKHTIQLLKFVVILLLPVITTNRHHRCHSSLLFCKPPKLPWVYGICTVTTFSTGQRGDVRFAVGLIGLPKCAERDPFGSFFFIQQNRHLTLLKRETNWHLNLLTNPSEKIWTKTTHLKNLLPKKANGPKVSPICFKQYTTWWLNQPIWKKYARQIGSSSRVGVKMKNIKKSLGPPPGLVQGW